MGIILHNIKKRDDGDFDLEVSQNGREPVLYQATFSESEEDRIVCCTTDDELFFLLSNAAHKRYGNCAVYQMELVGIMRAFANDENVLMFPVEMGTTSYCTLKPTLPKILWNKLWILLYRVGLVRPTFKKYDDAEQSQTAEN